MAGHLGMPLREYMVRVSPQEHDVWAAHLAARWEHPGPVEWYLMQVAAEVRRWMAKEPEAVKVEDLRLRFKPAEPVRRNRTPRQAPAAPPAPSTPPATAPGRAQTPEEIAEEVRMSKLRLFIALGCPDSLREDLLRTAPKPAEPAGG